MNARRRISLTVVTGFLGAGKTTLLRRALSVQPRGAVAAVVNEVADEGIDGDVLALDGVTCLQVAGGCACCERREALLGSMRALLDARESGSLASLQHVVIETSGLGDPLSIVTAVTGDPVLRHHFELGAIVAVVDALDGVAVTSLHPEAARQVQSADRVLLSKTDLASAEQLAAVEAMLDRMQLSGAVGRTDEAAAARLLDAPVGTTPRLPLPAAHDHTSGLSSTSMTFDEPLDWIAFGVWLSLVLHAHGDRLLRVKGTVPVAGLGAISLNAVRRTLYPPEHVGTATDSARLVFVAQDIDAGRLGRSLRAFQRAA